jgi:hypothetical protein
VLPKCCLTAGMGWRSLAKEGIRGQLVKKVET